MSGASANTGISTNARIPQPSTPFVDAEGNVSREWLYFLIALLNRTGGQGKGTPTATLQLEITALQQQASSLQVLDALELEPNFTPWTLPILTGAALADDVPRASLNPFLAALIVADAT